MKKILLVLITMIICLTGCGKKEVEKKDQFQKSVELMTKVKGYHTVSETKLKQQGANESFLFIYDMDVNAVTGLGTSKKTLTSNDGTFEYEGYLNINNDLYYHNDGDVWYTQPLKTAFPFKMLNDVSYEKVETDTKDNKYKIVLNESQLNKVIEASGTIFDLNNTESYLYINNKEEITKIDIKTVNVITAQDVQTKLDITTTFTFSKLNDQPDITIPTEVTTNAIDSNIQLYTVYAETYALIASMSELPNGEYKETSLKYGFITPSKVNFTIDGEKVNGTIQYEKYTFTLVDGKVTSYEEAK